MNFGVEPQQNDAQYLKRCMVEPRDMSSTLRTVHGWATKECAQQFRRCMAQS